MTNEIVKDYQRKGTDSFREFFSNVGIGHLFVFVLIVAIIIYMGSKKNLDPRWHILMYGFLVLIIVIIYFKKPANKKLIEPKVAMMLADMELKRMIREGDCFPFDSKVYLTGRYDLKSKDDLVSGWSGYTHYEFGFIEQVHGSQFKRDYIIKIHATEGIALGIHEVPLGYSGKESASTVRTIPVAVFQGSIGSDDISKGGEVKR